jgi:hypothetical protein
MNPKRFHYRNSLLASGTATNLTSAHKSLYRVKAATREFGSGTSNAG